MYKRQTNTRKLRKSTALALALAVGTVGLADQAFGAARVFTQATPGTYDWKTPSNWVNPVVPGNNDTADFLQSGLTGDGDYVITLASDAVAVQNIRFGTTADGALTKQVTINAIDALNASKLTITGTGVAGSNGLFYRAANTKPVIINTGVTIAGDLVFAVNVASSAPRVTINGIVGESGGSRSLQKEEEGYLLLTNANNNFSGEVFVRNGTLGVSSIGALGTGSTVRLGNASTSTTGLIRYSGSTDTLNRDIIAQTGGTGGGWINVENAGTTLTLGDATKTISGNGLFLFGGAGNVIVDSKVTITNRLTKNGAGTGTLTNASNTYTGNTRVRNGTLVITQDGALGNSTGITFSDADTSNANSSLAFLTKFADGATPITVVQPVTVNNNNSTGLTTLGADSAQKGRSTIFSGTLTLNHALQLTSDTEGDKTVLFSGKITDGAGTFGVTKIGGGTVVLSNTTNDYNGGTTVLAGTLNVTGSLSDNGSDKVFIAPGNLTGSDPTLIRSVPGGGSYAGLGASVTSGLLTKADIRAGVNFSGSDNTVAIQWRLRAASETIGTGTHPPLPNNAAGLASEVISITGLANDGSLHGQTDPFALQLTYDDSQLVGDENDAAAAGRLYLATLDISGTPLWVNAVDKNFYDIPGGLGDWAVPKYLNDPDGGGPLAAGSWEAFAYEFGVNDGNLGHYVGSWGVDTAENKVWAVLNHNSEFAVVPEPASLGLMGIALGAGILRPKRRRSVR